MRCDRGINHSVGQKVLEVEVYNTAGTDSENRELCLKCINKALENGHHVEFFAEVDHEIYLEYENLVNQEEEMLAERSLVALGVL